MLKLLVAQDVQIGYMSLIFKNISLPFSLLWYFQLQSVRSLIYENEESQ